MQSEVTCNADGGPISGNLTSKAVIVIRGHVVEHGDLTALDAAACYSTRPHDTLSGQIV